VNSLVTVFRDELRMLLFLPIQPRIREYGWLYLLVGLLCAWAAGIGRYWDHPRAELWQRLGGGSVLYCFALALVLYLFMLPLRPRNWNYLNVLIFVSMTAPPALLYALPTEMLFNMEVAQRVNLVFLGIVSVWRVALLLRFLTKAAGLSILASIVGAFTPMLLILTVLSYFNVIPLVTQGMAGNSHLNDARDDQATLLVAMLTFLAWYGAPLVLISYAFLVAHAWRPVKTPPPQESD
jgi:hypothetical protein